MTKLSTMEEGGGGGECSIGLGLGIGAGGSSYEEDDDDGENEDGEDHCHCTSKKSPPRLQFHMLFPPNPADQEEEEEEEEEEEATKINMENAIILKGDKANSNSSNCSKKKLKLTKEQSTLLDHSFTQHHTLNLTQKQELAHRLNLKPRQVEVWFQNRRARDKLKKTEADCEMLRKWCDNLSGENERLKRELQELRSMGKQPPPLQSAAASHHAAATMMMTTTVLTLCPSCEGNVTGYCNTYGGGGGGGGDEIVDLKIPQWRAKFL